MAEWWCCEKCKSVAMAASVKSRPVPGLQDVPCASPGDWMEGKKPRRGRRWFPSAGARVGVILFTSLLTTGMRFLILSRQLEECSPRRWFPGAVWV